MDFRALLLCPVTPRLLDLTTGWWAFGGPVSGMGICFGVTSCFGFFELLIIGITRDLADSCTFATFRWHACD